MNTLLVIYYIMAEAVCFQPESKCTENIMTRGISTYQLTLQAVIATVVTNKTYDAGYNHVPGARK